MSNEGVHDVSRAALELREQLASDKRRLAFFMGAGTSMAVGMPGIVELTTKVGDALPEHNKAKYGSVRSEMPEDSHIEQILDRVRLLRELLKEDEEWKRTGITGGVLRQLDLAICEAIQDAVCQSEVQELLPHRILAQWLFASHATRSWPIEIFTTNYDLLLEKAMEEVEVPFFDGFIGSVNPFFTPEAVDTTSRTPESIYPPRTWTRLWKLHGSVNWYLLKTDGDDRERVSRNSGIVHTKGSQLMIFPSREKYSDSRRLPFLTYQDRLRRFLSSGESVLFILGYSFSDEHLNEIIFQGLRSNNRLAVNAIVYGESVEDCGNKELRLPEGIAKYARAHRNLSVYGPDRAVIGGVEGKWIPPKTDKNRENQPYWSFKTGSFVLGDFCKFASYLERFIEFGRNKRGVLEEPLVASEAMEVSREG